LAATLTLWFVCRRSGATAQLLVLQVHGNRGRRQGMELAQQRGGNVQLSLARGTTVKPSLLIAAGFNNGTWYSRRLTPPRKPLRGHPTRSADGFRAV